MDFDKLRPGDLIKTTFGARGSQKAVVEKVSGRGTIYAKKWSASSGASQSRSASTLAITSDTLAAGAASRLCKANPGLWNATTTNGRKTCWSASRKPNLSGSISVMRT